MAKAIEILKENEENNEICEILNTLLVELPLTEWTEKNILDSIDQFVLDNGRMPVARDFNSKELPAFCTVKNRFGMSYEEFKNKYFSNVCETYVGHDKDEMLEILKKNT